MLAEAIGDRKHVLMLCQLIAGISCYVVWLTLVFLGTDSSQLDSGQVRTAVALGVGFGQLAMTGMWMAFARSSSSLSFGLLTIVLETLAVVFFSSVSARFIPPSFYIVVSLACAAQFLLIWGTTKTAQKVFGVSLACSFQAIHPARPHLQFGTRHLFVSMAVVAGLASFVQLKRTELGSLSRPLVFIGLCVGYYTVLCWPWVIACFSSRFWRFSAMAILVSVAIVLSQRSVFSYALHSGPESWLFFLCLDSSFLTSVIVHALVARHFGYRLH